MTELRVLNLNFWGLYAISKDRKERLKALVAALISPEASWDLVALEEVWSEQDYCFISENVRSCYPYSYYFYSGVVGSGVCVLSKGQITSVLTHVFTLNGYAHKINHGDWFAGKVVGLCKIFHKGLKINLYATHIHAEYNRDRDEYLPHRIAQAYELSQFVKMTSAANDDVNILAGDFNFEPSDLGYAIIRRFADLKDAWVTRVDRSDSDDGNTCNTPDNIYSVIEHRNETLPRGKRIDFIMYGNVGGRAGVSCSSCRPVLNKIPGTRLCYSDHKGLEAVFQVGSTESAFPDMFSPAVGEVTVPNFQNTFDEALEILELGLRRVRRNKQFFLVVLLVCLAFLIGTAELDHGLPAAARWAINFGRTILVMIVTWCTYTAAIALRIEYHALLSAKNAMLIQRKSDGRVEGTKAPGDTGETQVKVVDSKSGLV